MARFYQLRTIGAPKALLSRNRSGPPAPPKAHRVKTTQRPELSEPCLKCGFAVLMPSKPRGLREEFLEVVGVGFYRCHNCEARYRRVGRRKIGTRSPKDRTHVWAFFALGMGLLSCATLALYIQKLAHRWPF